MISPVIPFVCNRGDANTEVWVAALQRAIPEARIVSFDALTAEEKTQCTVAIVANPSAAELLQLTGLRWVHSVWAGVEGLVHALSNTPITIVRLVDSALADTMAEAVLAWTLYLHRDMPAYAQQQRERRWQQHPYVRPQDRTVSLLGLGVLGEAAAKRLSSAGFRLCGWSRTRKSLQDVECFAGEDGLQAMSAQTDVLVCLLPLTPQTHGLVDAQRLRWLRRGASLINFARGRIVNDDDLRTALDEGQVAHAVLDVFDIEPLPADRWQWTHPRVTVLPHCSAPTNRETASRIVAERIRAYLASGVIPPGVDPGKGY
jgi:glyoxylate/hydroxypyruvate reductase A